MDAKLTSGLVWSQQNFAEERAGIGSIELVIVWWDCRSCEKFMECHQPSV
jgi:hypothetical protein